MNSETSTIKHYDDFKTKGKGWAENRVLSLFTDREGNLWAGGSVSSISLYLPGIDVFHHYQNDALLKSSVAGNAIITFYQAATGMIWAGSEGYGVERFHLKNTLFTSFQPQVLARHLFSTIGAVLQWRTTVKIFGLEQPKEFLFIIL